MTPVAPHAGAWIETGGRPPQHHGIPVAPHAGAWIETAGEYRDGRKPWSPPMRGRGLKHDAVVATLPVGGRPPCGGVD